MMLSQRASLSRAIWAGQRRYVDDPRYDTEHVTLGFQPRLKTDSYDESLFERICDAYIKTITHELEDDIFGPNSWWRIVRREHLAAVKHALSSRDTKALQTMYRNFFRDRCGAGLTGLPVNMARAYLSDKIQKKFKHLFLIDTLHQLDTWSKETSGRFSLGDLQGPDIGNPFGISLGQTFVASGAPYHHFYAQKIGSLLKPDDHAVVIEIGGGYGAMAYYLIRDHPNLTYIAFDVSESIALASYYLLCSFPQLKITLYDEAELTPELFREPGLVLLPSFAIAQLPGKVADLSFAAHVFSDMSCAAVQQYTGHIIRCTKQHFLHLNRPNACSAIARCIGEIAADFRLVSERLAVWNSGKNIDNDETECLYAHDIKEKFGAYESTS